MTTTNTGCLCSEYNAPFCAKRRARGLLCFKLTPASTFQSPYVTFAEAEAEALKTGGRVRAVSTLGHYGSPRKFYVEAAR
jgi:hypothetical protein